MLFSRRDVLRNTLAAGAAAALPSAAHARACAASSPAAAYAKLDEILKQPVFKRELFPSPVVIESLELLHYKNSYLCRERSKDGAEGISVGNTFQLDAVYPVFVRRLQPFFIGKDARDLETSTRVTIR